MAARWWTILALIQPSWSTDTGRFGFFFRFWKMACNNDKNRVVLCVCVCVLPLLFFLSFSKGINLQWQGLVSINCLLVFSLSHSHWMDDNPSGSNKEGTIRMAAALVVVNHTEWKEKKTTLPTKPTLPQHRSDASETQPNQGPRDGKSSWSWVAFSAGRFSREQSVRGFFR